MLILKYQAGLQWQMLQHNLMSMSNEIYGTNNKLQTFYGVVLSIFLIGEDRIFFKYIRPTKVKLCIFFRPVSGDLSKRLLWDSVPRTKRSFMLSERIYQAEIIRNTVGDISFLFSYCLIDIIKISSKNYTIFPTTLQFIQNKFDKHHSINCNVYMKQEGQMR